MDRSARADATTPSAPSSSSKDAEAAPPTEVTIGGTRRATSTPMEHRLGRAEVRLVPGAFGDPFRAIESLPGIVPTVSGLPYFYVRGAPPSGVGYFIDDVRVPYVFHFALGPSVIQPALIDEVTLHPAAFPGRYGRYVGAIVAGKSREPTGEWRGEGQLRVFDAGAYAEAPLFGGRGSAGVGGRYSYTAGIFSLLSPDTTLDYRDYNARLTYDLDDRWRATAFLFGAYDYASQLDEEDGREKVLFASEFHRLDLRLDRRTASATSRVGVTVGIDRTRLEGKRFAQDVVVGARARHRVAVRADVDVEVGIDATIDHYSGDLPSPYAVYPEELQAARTFFTPRRETATGLWASASWHPRPKMDLTATMRGDLFTSDGAAEVGPTPRASMRIPLPSIPMAFLGAVAVAAQAPAFAIPIPAAGYRGLPGGLGYGYQRSAGVEVELPLTTTLRAIGFHHTYVNVRDFARDRRNLDFQEPQPVPRSPTQAWGLELSLNRKLTERVGGFVSLTLQRSIIGSTERTEERVSPFDRTYVLHVGASADLGHGVRAGARFLTYRGWPDEGEADRTSRLPKGRLPPFIRLDARLEKRWTLRQARYIAVVLEGLNVTASKEIVGRSCLPGPSGVTRRCQDDVIGPIVVPSLGVEGAL